MKKLTKKEEEHLKIILTGWLAIERAEKDQLEKDDPQRNLIDESSGVVKNILNKIV